MSYYNEWFQIEEFPDGQYEINKMGEVRNSRTGKKLKGSVSKDGYLAYVLTINNKTYRRLAHVLVAKQFIPNPNNYPIVNHIDENKLNPCINNLEWVTFAQNSSHGSAQERSEFRRSKPINEYDLNGRYIRTWKSVKEIYHFYRLPYDRDHRPSYFVKILSNNDNPDCPKLLFANRVFMRYVGETCDTSFVIKAPTVTRNDEYKMLQSADDVPEEYLLSPHELSGSASAILQEMIDTNQFLFSSKQISAIEYAIRCIAQVQNIKTDDDEEE